MRISDLMQPMLFSKKLQAKNRENNSILRALGAKAINYDEVNKNYLAAGAKCGRSSPTPLFIFTTRFSAEKICSKARKERFSTSISELTLT